MRIFIFSTILLFTLRDCSCYRHQTKRSFLFKVKRDNDVRILESGKLADGTKFEKIQESGNELPPLPIEEEVDQLDDRRIGHLDENGDVLVPVDENGNVLKGYEYLLKPIIVQIDISNAERGNKNIVHDAKILPADENNSRILSELAKQEKEPRTNRMEGDYYQEQVEEEREPDIPKLPSVDYNDSGESDEDLAAKTDEVDRLSAEVQKEADEDEISIPSNKISDSSSHDGIKEYNPYKDAMKDDLENILKPDPEIKEIPIPVDKEENKEIEIPSDLELTDEDIQELAEDLGNEVLSNVMNKAGELFESEKEEKMSEISADNLDGYVLEVPDLTEDEKERIKEESERSLDIEIPSDPNPVPIVRGGRITPDAANSLINLFSITSMILIYQLL